MTEMPGAAGWNVTSDEDLLGLLRRAAAGEDPGLLMAEMYANAEIETGGEH